MVPIVIAAALFAALSTPAGPPPAPSASDGPSEERALTWPEALALARERAPLLQLERARVAEARARVVGASNLLPSNPELGLGAGARLRGRASALDLELNVAQTFEPFWRRSARMDAADADVEASLHDAADLERRLVGEVASAFVAALHAAASEQIDEAERLAVERMGETIARRHAAGEASRLDVNGARMAAARARAAQAQSASRRLSAEGQLRALLGIDAATALRAVGDLDTLAPLDADAAPSALDQRPDALALQARRRAAEAEQRQAASRLWPELALGAGAALDDGDTVVAATVGLSLPFFEHGQGAGSEAGARAQTLRREQDAVLASAAVRHASARDQARRIDEVLAFVKDQGVVAAIENQALARRAFEAGEIGLVDLLAVEREANAVRRLHLDLQADAALARVTAQTEIGALP